MHRASLSWPRPRAPAPSARWAVACALCALLAAQRASPAAAEGPDAPQPFFLRGNGAFYHYPRENSTTFASITARIQAGYYAERGIHSLSIYCPYKAADGWRGVPAQDFFATNANTGSIEDFRAMASAAHEHGMAVIAYMGLLFVDFQNPRWLKAQEDHAAGVSSAEEASFRWAENEDGEFPMFGGWEYSDIAGAFYATSWAHPALDLSKPAGSEYLKSVLAFWIDLGLDGFEYDAPHGFWGGSEAVLKQLLSDFPQAHAKRPLYLIAEGAYANPENEQENDDAGFTHILLSGDYDDWSIAWDAIRGMTSLDQLEAHFARYLDPRRERGHGAKAVSLYIDMSAEERALDAALLAGSGAYLEIEYDTNYAQLSPAQQSAYDKVLKALAGSRAEAPGAARRRLPTADQDSHYAVLRTSADSAEHAVNVYNLARTPATVSVDVLDAGIPEGELAYDLVQRAEGPRVEGGTLRVSLPALGYAFYRFGSSSSDDGGVPPDAGAAGDAGAGGRDAGASERDAGGSERDAGGSRPGVGDADAGSERDAGELDGGADDNSDDEDGGVGTGAKSGGDGCSLHGGSAAQHGSTWLLSLLALAARGSGRKRSTLS